MTNKERKSMIERWIADFNPNANLREPEFHCGRHRYAIFVGERKRCTDYLPLEQLEQYLLGVFNADNFKFQIQNNN